MGWVGKLFKKDRAMENDISGEDRLPLTLAVLPLKDAVLMEDAILPLVVSSSFSNTELVKRLHERDDYLVAVGLKRPNDVRLETWEQIYKVGCLAKITKISDLDNGETSIMIKGLRKVRIEEKVSDRPYLVVRISYLEDDLKVDKGVNAMAHSTRQVLNQLARLSYHNMESVLISLCKLKDPVLLLNTCTTTLPIPMEKKQAILEEDRLVSKYNMLYRALVDELDILELSSKITERAKDEINSAQREYYLRHQLKAIKKELGETNDIESEIEELRNEIKSKALPDEVKKDVEKDLKRLSRMQPGSAEYVTIRTYMDWILDLPWQEETEDNLDINEVERILDEDHFDLKTPKKRILEFLAVKSLKGDLKGPILCFVGPPGVGKTSLGRSIARAMGRKFVRISLGGVRDEAEIRGHRRTYIGAMPGRIINGIKQAGSTNPVFMLDEIDKLTHDIHGDPSSALLEALDPEQNNHFVDHYLNVPYDLSKTFFIATANMVDTIPPALKDRMEIVDIEGYTQEDKLEIAKHHLIPKEIEANGLEGRDIEFSDNAIFHIISSYTRESGVRSLQREIAAVLRAIASEIARNQGEKFRVDRDFVEKVLGPVRYIPEVKERVSMPGVATGLAWTPFGGEILFVEAALVEGKEEMILTGQMGDVMKESARIALSLVKSMGHSLPPSTGIHIHVPAGAIPKDGPSAGITIVTSIVSLLTRTKVSDNLAMTGEITLRGAVLPVGGIKEKILAAKRNAITRVILPKMNEKDLREMDEDAIKDIDLFFVSTIEEVLELAFPKGKASKDKTVLLAVEREKESESPDIRPGS